MKPRRVLSIALAALVAPVGTLRAQDKPAPAAPAPAPGAPEADKGDALMNAATPDDEIKTLVREGVDLWERGKVTEAWAKIQKAFEREPADDLALYLRDEIGLHTLYLWMREGWQSTDPVRRRFADTALHLIKLSEPAIDKIRRDPKIIEGYIEGLKKRDFEKVWTSIHHLVHIGPWGIPWLVSKEVLGNEKEDDFRANVIQCLIKMREDAVWPLIEALHSKTAFLRQNAAIVLGHIRDERALAPLKWVVEDPNEAPEVKFRAAEALQKITGTVKIDDLKTAKEYYYLIAEKYYYSQPSVIRTFGFDWLAWRWDEANDALLMREVPPFALNEVLAEEACYRGLGIDPEYTQLWGLFGCVHASQVVEDTLALEGVDEKIRYELMTQKEVDKIKEQVKAFEHGEVLANLVGRRYLYRSLERSLDDATPLVSVAIIRALRGMVKPDELPPPTAEALLPRPVSGEADVAASAAPPSGPRPRESYAAYPLIKALIDPDKRVRYAAAESLLQLNPPENFLGMEAITVNLIDAVGEMGVRVVLIIHDDSGNDDRRALADLKKKLVSLNCFPVVAPTAREGVVKATSFPSADLIMIQSKIMRQMFFEVDLIKKTISESAWDHLYNDVRTRSIPKYVLCENDKDMEEAKKLYEDKVWEYMVKPPDRLDLKNRLDKTFSAPEAQKDSKTRAEAMAKQAAEAFSSFDNFKTIYPFRDAVKALIVNLDPTHQRPDFIRIPCIVALGRFGDARAIDILAKLIDDKSNDKPVRVACGKALTDIYRQTGLAPSTEVYDILKKALLDGDVEVEVPVGSSFANSELTNVQRLELQRHRRLHAEKFKSGAAVQEKAP